MGRAGLGGASSDAAAALVAANLALYSDDPRGELYMRFTYDLWKHRVLPVWRQIMGQHGGWHEGGEYLGIGIGQAVYQVPAMWRSATGEDLFRTEPGLRGDSGDVDRGLPWTGVGLWRRGPVARPIGASFEPQVDSACLDAA